MQPLSICIVIPCFNESERLLVSSIKEFAEQNHSTFDLHLVNDCSVDNTEEILNSLSQTCKSKNIYSFSNPENLGKAETIRLSFLRALETKKYTHLAFWDADLSTPLTEINWFIFQLDHFKNKKIVLGSRVLRLGSNIYRKPLRQLFGRVFATVVSLLLKLPAYDTQCGAKLFNSECIKTLFSESFCSKWFFDVEILYRYQISYGKENALNEIMEVPLLEWQHKSGSKLKWMDFITVPLELYKIHRKYKSQL